MQKIVLKGTVFSGKGEGRKFIDLHWVKKQIEEKLGFTPYSGTLNIRLNEVSIKNKKLLENVHRFEIFPEKGFCTGILVKARIDSLECAIIIPEISNYPKQVLEIIAHLYLREQLHITDGDQIAVTVNT